MTLRLGVIVALAVGLVLTLTFAFTYRTLTFAFFSIELAIGLVLILVDRGRYRRTSANRSHLVPTDEWTIDPVSGQTIHVYVDARTGERDERFESRAASFGESPRP